jgi:hypothetical protein
VTSFIRTAAFAVAARAHPHCSVRLHGADDGHATVAVADLDHLSDAAVLQRRARGDDRQIALDVDHLHFGAVSHDARIVDGAQRNSPTGKQSSPRDLADQFGSRQRERPTGAVELS